MSSSPPHASQHQRRDWQGSSHDMGTLLGTVNEASEGGTPRI